MRVRSRGGVVKTPISVTITGTACNSSGCSDINGVGHRSPTCGSLEIFRDTVTPGYFKAARSGSILPINECSSERYEIPSSGFRAQYSRKHKTIPERYTQWQMSAPLPFDAFLYLAHEGSPADPLDTFTDDVASVRGSLWDFSTFLLEFGKTARMFTQLAGRILSFYRKIRRGLTTSRPDVVFKAVSDAWLEYRYGWRILYYDIQDFLKTLDRLNGVKEDIVRSSSEVSKIEISEYQLEAFRDDTNRYGTPLRVQKVTEWTTRSGAIGQTETSANISVDPIVTMWELTRWSFVLDWFLNVGSYLQSVSPFQRGAVHAGWASIKGTTTLRVLGYNDDASIYVTNVVPTPYKATYETYQRYPVDPSSGVQLRWRPQLSLSKIVDLFALSQAANGRNLSRR